MQKAIPIAVAAIVLSLGLVAKPSEAQLAPRQSLRDGFASRTELESLATQAERLAADITLSPSDRNARQATATVLRERLREGDFEPGDRIALVVEGAMRMNDTLVVRSGRTIVLPEIPEIQLAGVLRSELQSYLTNEVARYVRDPQLRARSLLRLTVTGAVAKPGFYSLPADAMLSDLVSAAGGPSSKADFEKSAIKRGDEELWKGKELERAISDGVTFDALYLRSGDQLVVKETKDTNWLAFAQGLGTIVGLVTVLRAIKH